MPSQFSLRVLVVHTDPQVESDSADSIGQENAYEAFAAQLGNRETDTSDNWYQELGRKVADHRCHIVLVDQALVDKQIDAVRLHKVISPARCVLYTGATIGTERAMRAFLADQLLAPVRRSPSRGVSLEPAIDQAVRRKRAGTHTIIGDDFLQEAADAIGVPLEEIKELLAYLFPSAHRLEVAPFSRDPSYSTIVRGRSALAPTRVY